MEFLCFSGSRYEKTSNDCFENFSSEVLLSQRRCIRIMLLNLNYFLYIMINLDVINA